MSNFTYEYKMPPLSPYERIYVARETDVALTFTPASGRSWDTVFIPNNAGVNFYSAATKVFTTDEIATFNDSYMVFFNTTTKDIDFYISSIRPVALTITAAGGLVTSVSYTLTKGAQIFWGQYTHTDTGVSSGPPLYPALDLFPSETLFPDNDDPAFIEDNIHPIISKLYFSGGW